MVYCGRIPHAFNFVRIKRYICAMGIGKLGINYFHAVWGNDIARKTTFQCMEAKLCMWNWLGQNCSAKSSRLSSFVPWPPASSRCADQIVEMAVLSAKPPFWANSSLRPPTPPLPWFPVVSSVSLTCFIIPQMLYRSQFTQYLGRVPEGSNRWTLRDQMRVGLLWPFKPYIWVGTFLKLMNQMDQFKSRKFKKRIKWTKFVKTFRKIPITKKKLVFL